MKTYCVLLLCLAGCGGGSSKPEYDLTYTPADFASTSLFDFSGARDLESPYDMTRTIVPTDMGNPTTAPSTGTNSSGSAIDSTIGAVIGSLIGTLLANGVKSSPGMDTSNSDIPCPSGLDVYGYCYNNSAVWCDDAGDAEGSDCGAQGMVCSYACPGSEGYANCCAPAGSVSACVESCRGTVLTYCNGSTAMQYDCSTNTDGNTSCGVDSDGYMSCIASVSGGCDGQTYNSVAYYGLTFQGTCDNNVEIYCDVNNTLQAVDCSTLGETCQWLDDSVGYTCN